MSATQILARIEVLLKEKVYKDTSVIFSMQHGGTFWVRTVTNDMRHIEGEGKTLLGAFYELIQNDAPTPHPKD